MEQRIITQYDAFPATRQYLSGRQVRMYEPIISQLNLEEKHIEFFRKSKKRRRMYAFLKVLGFLVLPAIAFLLFGLFRVAREADKSYALYYLTETASNIRNKNHAIRLAKDIYDKKRTEGYSDAIQRTFLGLSESQRIQGLFSDFTYPLATTSVNREDMHISGNGNFILVTDTSSIDARYKLFSGNGHLDTVFTGLKHSQDLLKYAYFINHSDSILLAYKKYNVDDSLFPQFRDYPDYFRIFNCRSPREESQPYFLDDGFLLPKATALQKQKSEYDTYRIRFTQSGNLLVPFFTRSDRNFLRAKLRVYRGKKILGPDRKSSSSVSVSKDGQRYCIGYARGGVPIAEFFSASGEAKDRITDVYFADFTAKGSAIYIRRGMIVLKGPDGDTSRMYYVSPGINYAWADGEDEKFILAQSNDSLFLVNTNGAVTIARFGERLMGASFADKFLITQGAGKMETGKPKGATLIRRSFAGKVTDSAFIAAGVKEFQFNDNRQELLILTDSNRLQLLDNRLRVRASFQLTANDLFGFSKSGDRLYYVRDNWLSVFSNNGKLIDLADFSATYAWLDRKEKEKKNNQPGADTSFTEPITKLRRDYHLRWPSRIF
jgi:hypothetical protein